MVLNLFLERAQHGQLLQVKILSDLYISYWWL